jgi:hypothetical protein
VKINSKASGRGKIIEEVFEAGDRRRIGLAEDQSVVGILNDRRGDHGGDRVGEVATLPGTSDDTLEDIHNNDEEVGESGSPWRKPLRQQIQSPGRPLSRIAVFPELRIESIRPYQRSSKPRACRIARRLLELAESKAFLKSILKTTVGDLEE